MMPLLLDELDLAALASAEGEGTARRVLIGPVLRNGQVFSLKLTESDLCVLVMYTSIVLGALRAIPEPVPRRTDEPAPMQHLRCDLISGDTYRAPTRLEFLKFVLRRLHGDGVNISYTDRSRSQQTGDLLADNVAGILNLVLEKRDSEASRCAIACARAMQPPTGVLEWRHVGIGGQADLLQFARDCNLQ